MRKILLICLFCIFLLSLPAEGQFINSKDSILTRRPSLKINLIPVVYPSINIFFEPRSFIALNRKYTIGLHFIPRCWGKELIEASSMDFDLGSDRIRYLGLSFEAGKYRTFNSSVSGYFKFKYFEDADKRIFDGEWLWSSFIIGIIRTRHYSSKNPNFARSFFIGIGVGYSLGVYNFWDFPAIEFRLGYAIGGYVGKEK